MTRHPLQAVFEQLDYPPAPAFRESLRAKLLAEIAASDTMSDSEHAVDVEELQELTVLRKVDRPRSSAPRTRAIQGVAATLIVVAAIAVVANNQSSTDAPVENSPDTAVAKAALITADKIGPEWSKDSGLGTSWTEWRAEFAIQPECTGYTNAVRTVEATAAGDIATFVNSLDESIIEVVSMYPTKAAASQVMDSIDAGDFPSCFFAAFDAAFSKLFPGDVPTSTDFDIAPPSHHGDRQISFGQEARTTGIAKSRLFQNVWIQIDESIIYIQVSPDGAGGDNPEGNLEKLITAAIGSLKAVLPTG